MIVNNIIIPPLYFPGSWGKASTSFFLQLNLIIKFGHHCRCFLFVCLFLSLTSLQLCCLSLFSPVKWVLLCSFVVLSSRWPCSNSPSLLPYEFPPSSSFSLSQLPICRSSCRRGCFIQSVALLLPYFALYASALRVLRLPSLAASHSLHTVSKLNIS